MDSVAADEKFQWAAARCGRLLSALETSPVTRAILDVLDPMSKSFYNPQPVAVAALLGLGNLTKITAGALLSSFMRLLRPAQPQTPGIVASALGPSQVRSPETAGSAPVQEVSIRPGRVVLYKNPSVSPAIDSTLLLQALQAECQSKALCTSVDPPKHLPVQELVQLVCSGDPQDMRAAVDHHIKVCGKIPDVVEVRIPQQFFTPTWLARIVNIGPAGNTPMTDAVLGVITGFVSGAIQQAFFPPGGCIINQYFSLLVVGIPLANVVVALWHEASFRRWLTLLPPDHRSRYYIPELVYASQSPRRRTVMEVDHFLSVAMRQLNLPPLLQSRCHAGTRWASLVYGHQLDQAPITSDSPAAQLFQGF